MPKKIEPLFNHKRFLDLDEKTGVYTIFEVSDDFVMIQNARLPVFKFIKKISKKEALEFMEGLRDYMKSIKGEQEAQDFFSQKVIELKIVDMVKGNP